ncbi:ATP-dependent DNA helicase PIF1-like protein [Tanacetum coccineum]
MALCQAYGNPDLFITFTSNPKWPEIGELLAFIPGQKPYERPKVCTRVFKLKLTHLLDDLTKNEIFGKTCAVVYVIEFQKCGLPHAYILLWLEEEWKCKTPNQVDDIISADLPSLTTDPEGYKVVTEFMLHGSYGKGDACTVEGKCSKTFPKPFYSETNLEEDGYPVYRRRDSKVQAVKGKFTYDNKYVVPYNRYLLLKYQAHINVEWCNRSKAIKYLFKYLNKGPDRATFVIQENVQKPAHREHEKVAVVDEIKNYLNCRYLAPCEAPTFKAACFAYGLLNDDKEWAHAIKEAAFWALAPQLRDLFVTMLLFYDVSRPLPLWEQTWELLSDDILRKKRKLFKLLGTFVAKPGIVNQMDNRLIREAMDFDIKTSKIEHDQLHLFLNLEQRVIYDHVIQSVHNQSGQFYFVYGPGGTGNTFLYKTIISRLRSECQIVLAVASSGGRTAHSRFVIPLELVKNSTCGIKQNTHLAELLQQVQLIIWDEAPMTQKYAFEALDKTLRDILGYKNPEKRNTIFGGVTVLLGGDFRQILPVIPKGKRAEIVQAWINRPELWKSCKVFTLTQSMRVNEYSTNGEIDYRKKKFNKWVLDVGDGAVEAKKKEDDDEPTWIEISEDFIINAAESPIEQTVNETFPDFTTRKSDGAYLKERAILTPRNDDADAINAYMFSKFPGPTITYNSADEVCKASTDVLEQ